MDVLYGYHLLFRRIGCILGASPCLWQPAAAADVRLADDQEHAMIRKLSSGEYRLYSRKTDPKTGKRRNLGTFKSRAAAEKHERAVQYFKRH
jgi:hypothetical protein